MKYRVSYYAPDGHGGRVANPPAIDGETFGTLAEARQAITHELGDRDYGTWPGEDNDIEAWHESEDEGCGGYAITEA